MSVKFLLFRGGGLGGGGGKCRFYFYGRADFSDKSKNPEGKNFRKPPRRKQSSAKISKISRNTIKSSKSEIWEIFWNIFCEHFFSSAKFSEVFALCVFTPWIFPNILGPFPYQWRKLKKSSGETSPKLQISVPFPLVLERVLSLRNWPNSSQFFWVSCALVDFRLASLGVQWRQELGQSGGLPQT